jgi:hypothetical protein
MKSKKVSTDRMFRFISDRKNTKDDHLTCGDFINMSYEGTYRLCQVLGFKYLSGNERFTASSCPIKCNDEKARGVAVFVNFYKTNANTIAAAGRVQRYINIDNYKSHVLVKRDPSTNSLIIETLE